MCYVFEKSCSMFCVQGYLCIGYYVTMTDSYMITWTTPQCVLTLRLIGLTYDVYDGQRVGPPSFLVSYPPLLLTKKRV